MSFANPLNNERLAKSISNDIHTCEQLLKLLEQEREFLTSRDIEGLDPLIDAKSQLLSKLHQSANSRTQWAALYQAQNQAQTEQNELNQEHNFEQFAKENNLAEQWLTLKSLLKSCKSANDINGKAITRSQSTHEQLLNILRGQGANNNLYTGKGTKKNQASRGTLGEA